MFSAALHSNPPQSCVRADEELRSKLRYPPLEANKTRQNKCTGMKLKQINAYYKSRVTLTVFTDE